MSQTLNSFIESTRPFEGKFDNDLAGFIPSIFEASAVMESSFTADFLNSDTILPSLNETANALSNSSFAPAESPLPLMSSFDVPKNTPAIKISNSLDNKWDSTVDSFNALPKTQDELQAIGTAQNMITVINNKSLLENPFSGETSGELITLLAETPPDALGSLSKELVSNGAELGQNHLDLTFQFLEGKDFTTAVDLFHQADIKQNLNLRNPFDKGMNIGLHALGNAISEPEKFIDGIIDATTIAGTLLGHSLLGTNRLTKHTEAAEDSREYVSNFTSKVIDSSIEGSEKYLNLGIPETLAGQLAFGGMTAATGGIALEAGAITAAGKIVNAANKLLPTDGLNGQFLAQSIGRALPALEERYLSGNILLPSFSHRFNAIPDDFSSATNVFKKLTNEFDPNLNSKAFSDNPDEWLEIPGNRIDLSFTHGASKSVSEIQGDYSELLIGIYNRTVRGESYDDKVSLIQTEKKLLEKLKGYGIPTLEVPGFARVVGDGPHISKTPQSTDFYMEYKDGNIGYDEYKRLSEVDKLYRNIFNINSVGNSPPIELEKGFPAIIYERVAGGSLKDKSTVAFQGRFDTDPYVEIHSKFNHFITPESIQTISLIKDTVAKEGIYINDLELFLTKNNDGWGVVIGDPTHVGTVGDGAFSITNTNIYHKKTYGILSGYQTAFEKIIKER